MLHKTLLTLPQEVSPLGPAPLPKCGALTMVIMLAIHAGNIGLQVRPIA